MYKFLFFLVATVSFSFAQTPDLSKYNEQIQSIQETVKYFESVKVTDQFYMLVGGGGNVGLFISQDGIVMIDNKYEILEDLIMSAVREHSDKPIKYIINTHFHHDHSDGNKAFGKEGIPIISHRNAKKSMEKATELYGGIYAFIDGFIQDKYPAEALPGITFEHTLSITEGTEEIGMYHFGKGHTDGDTIILFKNANIMHTGDSFVRYGYPYVDLNNGGSVKGLIEVLGMIAALANDETRIMPGHGEISTKQDVIKLKNSLHELYQKTVLGLKNGLSPEAIASSIGETLAENEAVKLAYIKTVILELTKDPEQS
jgi:glyoxylase-like metal-dependent hydrolase (beta-lactamase superfamily II)